VRRRILLLVVGMTTLVVLAFAIPLTILIRHNAYQNGVQSLQDEAGTIALVLRGDETPPTAAQLTTYLVGLNPKRPACVELPDGSIVGRTIPGDVRQLDQGNATGPSGNSHGEGDSTPVDHPVPPQTNTQPWQGGQLTQLHVPGQGQGQYTISVWASDATLHDSENGWFLLLGGAAVFLLLVGVVAGELLTRRIVRPLVDTARTAAQLSAGDTAARAPTDGPGEVADVGRALNRLADRIDELIAEERETVADLSHRLRTPLTALRLDAEALRDPAEAERMGGHATTLERMLTAVIHAARRPQREGRLPSCDATAVVAERVGFWSALTDDQERTSTIDLPSQPLVVRAAGEDLAAAVDALLENVVAHTPEGTAFGVRLTARAGGGARLEISDDGPGIPAEEPVRGRSDRGSTGLGLDIARRCAESSGGTMTIGSTASGGALVVLELGAP
jgi:signal transduction histidine kinase